MKTRAVVALTFGALSLGGCMQAIDQLNRDLAAINQQVATTNGTMASNVPQSQQIQLIVPNDSRAQTAVDAALPTIKKALAIHQCVRTQGGMLQLNALAIPGVNVAGPEWWNGQFPNSSLHMRYHDRSKCVTIRAIDNFAMPAFNALNFRVVYFAEDSGETVNFGFQMKKTEDGKWLLSGVPEKAG